jgi:hypothetical protein
VHFCQFLRTFSTFLDKPAHSVRKSAFAVNFPGILPPPAHGCSLKVM